MQKPFKGNYGVSNPFGVVDWGAYGNYPDGKHSGTDYPLPIRTPLYAAISGFVTAYDRSASIKTGRGKEVVITNGPMEKKECHLDEITVKSGQFVKKGQLIGYSGNTGYSTGPHLHSELKINGVYIDQEKYKEEDMFTGNFEGKKQTKSAEDWYKRAAHYRDRTIEEKQKVAELTKELAGEKKVSESRRKRILKAHEALKVGHK